MSSTQTFTIAQLLDEASDNRDAGNLDEAARIYRSILQENPQNSEAQKGLHALNTPLKNTPVSGNRRSRRVAKSNGKARTGKAGSVSKQGSAQTVPGPQPHPYDIQRLKALYTSGQLLEVEVEARQLIKEYPHAVEVINLHGAALSGLGRNKEAIACYVQAITIKPDYAEANNNLGTVLERLGLLKEAVESYQLAITADPEFSQAYNNLGAVLRELGKPKEAVTSYVQALRIQPDSEYYLTGFAEALALVKSLDGFHNIEKLMILCFESAAIDSAKMRPISHAILRVVLKKFGTIETVTPDDLLNFDQLTGGLLVAHLRNTLISDSFLENFLGRVRNKFLDLRAKRNHEAFLDSAEFQLLESLAYQGFLNEYLWDVTDQENSHLDEIEAEISADIRDGGTPTEFDLFLLAAYRSLYEIEIIRSWALKHHGEFEAGLKKFLEFTIVNSAKEQEIGQQIEWLTSIDDNVSLAVRSQYEENPYPRWDSVSVGKPNIYTVSILNSISPHKPILVPTSSAPDVLIAGCGTGKHPIAAALSYQHSKVLAVDLSRASLAFAKRKAKEIKVKNIKFAHADILKLGELGSMFDIVECSGVLHHMDDPEAGLKELLDRLKPGGYLNIGLYSELARQHIVALRKVVSEKQFLPSLQGMRDFRAWLRAGDTKEARLIQESNDFYSASMLRDLIFHVKEHRFTLPQIVDLLDRHKLEFLGFLFLNPFLRAAYLKLYPNDPDCLNLDNWHQFEQDNPNTFSGMYQFWCRKSA